MKILLTHRYFAPDTPPYASMLDSIARGLSKAGHDVRVFSTLPSYKTGSGIAALKRETRDGLTIHRIRTLSENRGGALRALNALWYALALFTEILRVRPDAVHAATFPPIIAGWVASLAARLIGARFVYHMQDVHPEVSLYSSGAMGRGLALKIARWADNATLRRASQIVVLSEDMKNTVLDRGGASADKIRIINNFLPEAGPATADVTAPSPSDGALTIIFAGNIGGFQGLNAVIEAAHMTADLSDLHYWFVGDGSMQSRLIEQAGALKDQTIFFTPFQPHAVAQEMIRQADLALAALSPSIFRVSYPSKVLTYLALGAPILAIVEPESELSRMIEAEKIGFSASPGDAAGIAKAARLAWDKRDDLSAYGARGEALYADRFSLARALDHWCAVYTD